MEKKSTGTILAIFGLVMFILTFILILPIPEFYFVSLVLMFIAVVFVGLGSAIAKGFDKSIETPTEPCYYCNGTGKITIEGVEGVCPRCGGSGLAREDDITP